MNIIKRIFLFILLLSGTQAFAQEVHLDAVLDTSKMRIGEQAKIDIYVTYNSREKDIRIQWPEIGDTLTGKIEVISVSPIDTMFPDKTNSTKIFQHQQILVSVYDSGYYAIPGFKFVLNNDTAHPQYTQPLFLEVHTVPTDTSASKLKDIKPPFEEKFNWKWYLEYIYWGIAILVLLITIVLVTSYYARKNKQVVLEPEKPKIPAHITALALLNKIKEEQVWKEGKVKEYYSSISETVRAYIENRFNVHALESTTDEIMSAFRSQVVDKDSKDKLQQLLTLSDLVKFAKMFPIEDEHNFTLQNAFDFVNGTKREEELQEGAPQIDYTSEEVINEILKANEVKPVSVIKPLAPKKKADAPYTNDTENLLREERLDTGKKRLKKVAIIVGIILGVVITGIVIKTTIFPGAENSVIVEVAELVNKQCPLMVDQQTRLDNVVAISDEIQFNYTLINASIDQMDVSAVKDQLEPAILEQVKTRAEMEQLRAAKANMKYSYSDRAGNFLFSFKITPADYNTYN